MGHVREDSVTITFQDYLFCKYNITGKEKFGNSRLRFGINHSISAPRTLRGHKIVLSGVQVATGYS